MPVLPPGASAAAKVGLQVTAIRSLKTDAPVPIAGRSVRADGYSLFRRPKTLFFLRQDTEAHYACVRDHFG